MKVFDFSSWLGALETVVSDGMASSSELGFAAILALNHLVGVIFISFSITLPPFLALGLVSSWKGLNWILRDWGFRPNSPSNSKMFSFS